MCDVACGPFWIVKSPSVKDRSLTATLIADWPPLVVCSNETPAVTETPAIPSVTTPVARSSCVVYVIGTDELGPVGTVKPGIVEKSITGTVVPAPAAESLEPLMSTVMLVAWSVTPVTPTSAIELADAVSA